MSEVMRWIPPFLAIAMVTACSPPPKAVVPAVTVTARPWEGWTDALVVANGIVEVVVVPSIGRIMEFRMAGEMNGPFWHDAALHGQPVDPGGGERAYVELETLGPMALLKPGGSCEAVNRYTLGRRDPVRAAAEEAAAAARVP